MGERFRLSKWYLDCVGERGEAFIAYWAELRWGRLAVFYASTMLFADEQLEERSSLHAGPAPSFDEGRVQWSCDALESGGVWVSSPPQPSFDRVLHRQGDGLLEWRCLQPLARATVECRGRRLCGSGYTECLTLTLAPWELPIDELRWGRAHFPGRSVVWVDWTGASPQRLVLVDGIEIPGAHVDRARIEALGMALTLDERRVLREGLIADTSVGLVPGVREALSRARLLVDEHKWLATATLEENGVTRLGTAIHEEVKWR